MPNTAAMRRRSRRAIRCENANASDDQRQPRRARRPAAPCRRAASAAESRTRCVPSDGAQRDVGGRLEGLAENVARSLHHAPRTVRRSGAATRPATPHLSSLASRERQSGMRPSPVNWCPPRRTSGPAAGGSRRTPRARRRRRAVPSLRTSSSSDANAVVEALLVTRLDGRDDLVVELVELVRVVVGEARTALRWRCGRSRRALLGRRGGRGRVAGSERLRRCGAGPCPSSARSRARSSSTPRPRTARAAGGRCRPGPP